MSAVNVCDWELVCQEVFLQLYYRVAPETISSLVTLHISGQPDDIFCSNHTNIRDVLCFKTVALSNLQILSL